MDVIVILSLSKTTLRLSKSNSFLGNSVAVAYIFRSQKKKTLPKESLE